MFFLLQKICLNFRALFDWLWMTGNLKRASSSWKERTKRTMSLFLGDLSKNFFILVLNFVFSSSLNVICFIISMMAALFLQSIECLSWGRNWGFSMFPWSLCLHCPLSINVIVPSIFPKEISLKLIPNCILFLWNYIMCSFSFVLQTPWRLSVFLFPKKRAIQVCKFWTLWNKFA